DRGPALERERRPWFLVAIGVRALLEGLVVSLWTLVVSRLPRAGPHRRTRQQYATRPDRGTDAGVARGGTDAGAQPRTEERAKGPALSRARPWRPLWRGPGLLGRPLATDGIVGLELIKRLARPRQHHDARAERHRRAGAEREGEYQREGSRPHLRVPSHLWGVGGFVPGTTCIQPPGH